jgi:hypothetical protein
LAEPLGAGNFWPTIVLAAELATAAELPGRAIAARTPNGET